ncbi:hypothetical protein M2271_007334 [Streptomyces sp. LBL]|nr:hypothetical protein [Streptomyces sp. LBL]MDH6629498.1 hypothetical protein [Streptomyces sp. LBL]
MRENGFSEPYTGWTLLPERVVERLRLLVGAADGPGCGVQPE